MRGSVVTKPTLRRVAGLDDADRRTRKPASGQLIDRLKTAELFESSAAMLRLADAAIAEYERLKRQRGVLDFEDLIVKTVALLSRADAARWVHYKLDRGIDHILVDEAQDTSPRQWQVIRALAEEFFAGEGAGGGPAHAVRRRRREAVDLFVPGRGAGMVHPRATRARRARPPPAATRGTTSSCIFPSARCRWCSRRSMRSSPTRRCTRA